MEAIERTLELDASPERVWRALTDPAELASWFPDESATVDAVPGAEGWLAWKRYGCYAIRFDIVDPPRRLVWTWARQADTAIGAGEETVVEWRLEPRGAGTVLHLRESGFRDPKHRDGNVEGWTQELGELRRFLDGALSAASGRVAR